VATRHPEPFRPGPRQNHLFTPINTTAFQCPPFRATPVAVIADEADPERAEIIAFRIAIEAWCTSVIAAMTILNPN
jgi:hypothetical protein